MMVVVIGDFGCAFSYLASRRVDVLSDGTPWRPLIDVHDMARAMEWAITRDRENGGPFLSVNVGAANHQIGALAEAVATSVSGTTVSIARQAPPAMRTV